MKQPVVISAIQAQFTSNLDLNGVSSAIRDGYRILKVRTKRNDSQTAIGMQVSNPMSVTMASEVLYSVEKKEFLKNRYAHAGATTTMGLPKKLSTLFDAVVDASNGCSIEQLRNKHSRMVLLEAIYLTDRLDEFIYSLSDSETVDYQLVRYRYGKEVQPNFIELLVELYPEKMI